MARGQSTIWLLPSFAAIICGLVGWLATPDSAAAQGSIFGTVVNSDLTIPANGEIQFIGYIDGTDNEMRLHSSIGAGYDLGHWFDFFPNYGGISAGQAYKFLLFNTVNGEAANLDGTVPDSGFHQDDVALTTATWPSPAAGLSATSQGDQSVTLEWQPEPNVTWHVYRRDLSSAGSWLRIDDPSGNLSSPGVTTPMFIDTEVTVGSGYSYVLVTQAAGGSLSPPSAILDYALVPCCQGMVGNVNLSPEDAPTIGDIAMLVDHLFISRAPIDCLAEADTNQSGGANPVGDDITIGDIGRLVDHLYISRAALPDCL